MWRAWVRGSVAVLCAAAMVVSGCSSKKDGAGPREAEFSSATVQNFITQLAGAGVAVYPNGSGTPKVAVAGRSAMALTEEQATSAALGVWARAGLSGADIDRLVTTDPLEAGATPIPASLLLAAWAHSGKTPASKLAREYLSKQDLNAHSAVVFPAAVLVLFVADIAGPGTAGSPGPKLSGVTSTCETFKNFVFGTIEQVFAALGRFQTVGLSGDVWQDILPFIRNAAATLGNLAIDSVKFIVVNGVKVAIGPIVNAVAAVAGVVAIASTVVLTLQPWTGQATPEPLISRRDASAHPGTLTVRVRGGLVPDEWPSEIAGCARAANVELPSLKPRDADVTWNLVYQGPGPMIVKKSDSGPLGTDSTARMNFETLPEPPDIASGEERSDGIVHVDIKLHRKDLDKLHTLLSKEILSLLPDAVRDVAGPQLMAILEPRIAAVLKPIETLRDVTVKAVIPVNYHTEKDDKTPPPDGSGGGNGSGRRGNVPGNCPLASTIGHGYEFLDSDANRFPNSLFCAYVPTSAGGTQLWIGLSNYREKFSDYPESTRFSLPGTDEAWIDDKCTSASGPCWHLRANVGDKSIAIMGAPSREIVIDIAKRILGLT